MPKLGWVRFRLSRPPPRSLGMARITCDKTGHWHVSFPAPQPEVSDAGRSGRSVGIDRGVATTIATSDGQMLRAPIIRRRERKPLARWQASLARQQKRSRRRSRTKARIARVHQQVADRRRNWVEKTTTRLAANYEAIAVEALYVRNMVRRPKPKPDPENPGQFLPNGAAAKSGLNRSIHANCCGLIACRLTHKMSASAPSFWWCRRSIPVSNATGAATRHQKTVRVKRSSNAERAAIKPMPTGTQQPRSWPGQSSPRPPPDRGQHRSPRVRSRKREPRTPPPNTQAARNPTAFRRGRRSTA